jgi:predicted  nucleic acid-binding Zn-ribbon protein
LTRVGHVWCIPDELALRDKLSELDRLIKRFHDARQVVEKLLEQNQAAAVELPQVVKLEKSIRDQLTAAKAGTPQFKKLESDLQNAAFALDQLHHIYSPPERLGSAPPLKPALVELATARAELTIKYVALQNTPSDFSERYDHLRQDATIAAALAELKEDQLGPSKQIQDKRKAIERIEPEILNDALPLYREGTTYRLTAIVDDHVPLTFGIGGAGDPTIIPQNIAEAVGVAATETSPRLKLRVAPNRDELVQEVKIAKLRFGRNVVTGVTAYILPPEAADLGARIGAKALPGYRVKINAERLQLVIEGVK